MRLLSLFAFIVSTILSATQPIDSIAKSGYCYSILSDVDTSTPLSESYFQQQQMKESCTLFDKPPLFIKKEAYVGCYKKKKFAKKRAKTLQFHFKNPKIVLHKFYDGTPYVLFAKKSNINLKRALKHLDTTYKQYSIHNVLQKFPTKYSGSNLEIYDLDKIDFLPSINLYSLYNYNGKKSAKVLIVRDGTYSIETIYKQLKNNNYVKKVDKNTYEINIPIVVMPTASLTFANKTIHLQTRPKSVAIMYYGNIYAKNSKFLTWDIQRDRYAPREDVPEDKILYTNYEKPRPYFLGLRGSKGYFVNNIFRGLGFHSTTATFGLGVLSLKESEYYPASRSFYYFLHNYDAPTGSYIGNDIHDGTMAIYTNGGKNIVYLGNYTYNNVIYNFDPHDYSTGLVIARNLSVGAKKAHGIIISRGCNNNYIAENISIQNSANGIMIDRLSNNNLIYNNLTYSNGIMGISAIESKNILVKNNMSVGNYVDGIMVRNTLNLHADNNVLRYNAKNGIEIMAKNIDTIPGRDFQRDPYRKASSAVVSNNNIQENYNANIMVKNSAAITMTNNNIPNNIALGGDLNAFYGRVIQNRGNFRLYGLGFPYIGTSTDRRKLNQSTYNTAKKIFLELSDTPNDYFPTHLAALYAQREPLKRTKAELYRASSRFSQGALHFLGYLLLSEAKKENFKYEKNILEGISYLIEDAIFSGSLTNYRAIEKIRLFIPNGEYYIHKAFILAKKRMQKGTFFDKKSCDRCSLCPQRVSDKNKIIGAFKVFQYNYKHLNAQSFIDYCHIYFNNYTIFTSIVKNSFDSLIKSKNSTKKAINQYNKKVDRLAKQNKVCAKYLDKSAKDFKRTQIMLQNEKMKKLKFIKPKVEELLQKINQFRLRKISMEQLLKLLQDDNRSLDGNKRNSSQYYEE